MYTYKYSLLRSFSMAHMCLGVLLWIEQLLHFWYRANLTMVDGRFGMCLIQFVSILFSIFALICIGDISMWFLFSLLCFPDFSVGQILYRSLEMFPLFLLKTLILKMLVIHLWKSNRILWWIHVSLGLFDLEVCVTVWIFLFVMDHFKLIPFWSNFSVLDESRNWSISFWFVT